MTTWLPLESNPEVLTKYMQMLGVSDEWCITDIYDLSPESLEWIPRPVRAVILLFPCSEAYEAHRAKEDEELKAKNVTAPEGLFYTKQYIHNACGTIALVHAVLNNPGIELVGGGVMYNYLVKSAELSPEERGKVLEADVAFTETHHALAQEGQTETPDISDNVNHHFITFINYDDKLYEMDGRKSFPIEHGKTSDKAFLHDCAEICKTFMKRDPEELRFTVLGLVPSS